MRKLINLQQMMYVFPAETSMKHTASFYQRSQIVTKSDFSFISLSKT
jgi:hypothetical protein